MIYDVRITTMGIESLYHTEDVLNLLNWLTDYSEVLPDFKDSLIRYSLFDTIEIGRKVYKLHHTALYGGYQSWYSDLWLPYSGKFGDGLVQHYNADKNKHSHRIAYYIEVK